MVGRVNTWNGKWSRSEPHLALADARPISSARTHTDTWSSLTNPSQGWEGVADPMRMVDPLRMTRVARAGRPVLWLQVAACFSDRSEPCGPTHDVVAESRVGEGHRRIRGRQRRQKIEPLSVDVVSPGGVVAVVLPGYEVPIGSRAVGQRRLPLVPMSRIGDQDVASDSSPPALIRWP